MPESSPRAKLRHLIDILPEDGINSVTLFVQFVISQMTVKKELSSKEFFDILDTLPYTDEELTEEDLRDIKEAEEALRRGEVLTMEEFEKASGLS